MGTSLGNVRRGTALKHIENNHSRQAELGEYELRTTRFLISGSGASLQMIVVVCQVEHLKGMQQLATLEAISRRKSTLWNVHLKDCVSTHTSSASASHQHSALKCVYTKSSETVHTALCVLSVM